MTQRVRLIIRTGPNAGQTVAVTENNFQIGRNRQCNLVLSDSAVSRLHAALRYHNDGYYLQDAQSTGGTYVNNARINAILIKPGDVIRIGNTEMIFEVEYQHNDAMILPTAKTQLQSEFLFESTLMDNPVPTNKYEPLEVTKASRPIGVLKKPPYSPDYQGKRGSSANSWLIGIGLIMGVVMLFFLLMVVLDSGDDTGQGILQPLGIPSIVGEWEAVASPGTRLTFGADGSFISTDGNNGSYTRTGNTINASVHDEPLTYLILSETNDEIILRRNNEVFVYNRIR